jgi:tetratricopeptide (TPR) repeat protein
MRNPLKWIASYLLLLNAGRYQGRRQFEHVVTLCLRAKALDPRSVAASLLLGDAYRRLKRYEDAKQVLIEALAHNPDDESLNKLLVDVLREKGEPITGAIPYIKAYLAHRTVQRGKFPMWMKVITKLLRKDFDWDAYGNKLYEENNEWAQWAHRVVTQYEQENVSIEKNT